MPALPPRSRHAQRAAGEALGPLAKVLVDRPRHRRQRGSDQRIVLGQQFVERLLDLAANALVAAVGGAGPRLILASLFAITALLGLFISNTATAVLMAPVALAMATDLGASPYPFAMTVALAASAAFMTPVSSPVNTLVVGPGNYAFGDFIRIGVPFTLVVLLLTVLLVPIVLPL